MSTLKGMLFSQFANEGLNDLVEEMRSKYKPKKGRRFNHNNITYEISRPILKENCIEFEISSKIPQDELAGTQDMKTYFQEIKKIAGKQKVKPVSIDMENIVWDSKKETEKERDYVKLVYQYSLDDLFDNREIIKRAEAISRGETQDPTPNLNSAFTSQGKQVLLMVRDMIHTLARGHIEDLIQANKEVKTTLAKS